jgi:hypothetical protein
MWMSNVWGLKYRPKYEKVEVLEFPSRLENAWSEDSISAIATH